MIKRLIPRVEGRRVPHPSALRSDAFGPSERQKRRERGVSAPRLANPGLELHIEEAGEG